MKTLLSPIPLVILDVQEAIDWPVWDNKNNPDYILVIEKLLFHWRANKWPVIHIKHDEETPTSTYHTYGPGNPIKQAVAPVNDEFLISKQQNCAFINTDFDNTLKGLGASTFVITGVVIHNSMDATIRAGKALGYKILLASDATTAIPVVDHHNKKWPAKDVYDLTLAILSGEYAEITSSEELMTRLEN